MAKRINSRAKGARGELELAHWLTERGFPARRGQQHRGGPDSPDVICERMEQIGWQVECKRVERCTPHIWLEKAKEDAGVMLKPFVAHRRNSGRWTAILYLEDFVRLLDALDNAEKQIKQFESEQNNAKRCKSDSYCGRPDAADASERPEKRAARCVSGEDLDDW